MNIRSVWHKRPFRNPIINISLLITSSILSLYLGEMLLHFTLPDLTIQEQRIQHLSNQRIQLAQQSKRFFDTRTKVEVVEALRQEGINAYPSVLPFMLLTHYEINERLALRPLGGLANVTNVQCNESGTYMIYRSDEYGFNNLEGTYSNRPIDIALIGDSYVEGHCVSKKGTIASHLENVGYTPYNLGMGGHGPLFELATLKEYAQPIAPEIVLWVYYESNDFIGLRREQKDPVLIQYLDPEFSQDLLQRQDEINEIYFSFLAREEARNQERLFNDLGSFIRLLKTRETIKNLLDANSNNISSTYVAAPEPTPDELQLFSEILALAQNQVSDWEGEFYFIYLPAWARFAIPSNENNLGFRDEILAIVEQQGIPIIDVVPPFEKHPDPLSLFPFQLQGHYTEEGYKLTAHTIIHQLNEDDVQRFTQLSDK